MQEELTADEPAAEEPAEEQDSEEPAADEEEEEEAEPAPEIVVRRETLTSLQAVNGADRTRNCASITRLSMHAWCRKVSAHRL
jgi:hypothetical protein